MRESLIIADLHLSPTNVAALGPFKAFLARAEQADAVYILGDLFDYWVGDDQPVDPGTSAALDGLAALPCRKYLQTGNRDFLIGQALLDRIGAELLPEVQELESGGQRMVLCHGDSLCTDDVAYQAMRQQLRSTAFQCDFLARPLEERIATAQALRARSRSESSSKPEDIMDVNADAVDVLMAEHLATFLIHGHTHRPAIHRLPKGRGRIVTGDWGAYGWLVAIGSESITLERFDESTCDIVDRVALDASRAKDMPA
ncbi:UDP-2,3-diacylglucosamine diphosphatase [Halothiobacillus diazotrophicus]|uniref:UDP-2,3-diacylglucosamine hydrolase n=1 Tax=Halothiobacillus diazotrophicus TaxID=1860122 RepID=A0A191ZEU8_9GAMM|nr:UDP-2,3-diacylglucosamine diphosphatase [Halothiobacillus diazotrophicus]ANJ66385.1 UDP-2,3-diacylglucosamine diphosphatase [Halothiobacillus diazotrophicus]